MIRRPSGATGAGRPWNSDSVSEGGFRMKPLACAMVRHSEASIVHSSAT